jgi:hypothetical protein
MESQEVKFDDLRSKCGIPGGNPKSNIIKDSSILPEQEICCQEVPYFIP